jgi:hypothetical protein
VRERVILAVKYTPAGSIGQVRKAVGGFLRYVQHRDVHPTQTENKPKEEVSGLLKYVAYRDRASWRAELFGPAGALGSADRKAFAAFVTGSIDSSRPQLYRGRDGNLHDRRRAVYRMVISPERASGLDLRRLTVASVSALDGEFGSGGVRWIAAIHRNTAHHHVHLVLAGMRADGRGGFVRVDITKSRLAAMKEALSLEIERQRREPTQLQVRTELPGLTAKAGRKATSSSEPAVAHSAPIVEIPVRSPLARRPGRSVRTNQVGSVVALRAVARRYQRQMERELEDGYRQSQWERAA